MSSLTQPRVDTAPRLLETYQPHADQFFSGVLADVLDSLGHRDSALPPEIRPIKQEWKILGRAVTLSAAPVACEPAKPYAVEMECVDALGPGDVLVATMNGDRSSALWGELLSTACQARGVAGVVIDGLTRDGAQIAAMDYPVFSSGFSPLDSKGRIDAISYGRPISIGRCLVTPGDLVFADIDGVVVIPQHLAAQALPLALEKVSGENLVRQELAKGRSVTAVFAEHGIL